MALSPLLADEGGWIALFDGESTNGWTPRAKVTTFEAKDGEIHLLSDVNVWVASDLKLKNFIVEAEVLLPEDAPNGFNSGLAFRCTGESGKPKGYQCEIDLGKPGGVFGIGLGGWLYPKKGEEADFKARIKEAAFAATEWNKLRVECQGARIKTFVNDVLISDIEDSKSLEGYFGIQHHGKGGTVKFRNLRAKNLD